MRRRRARLRLHSSPPLSALPEILTFGETARRPTLQRVRSEAVLLPESLRGWRAPSAPCSRRSCGCVLAAGGVWQNHGLSRFGGRLTGTVSAPRAPVKPRVRARAAMWSPAPAGWPEALPGLRREFLEFRSRRRPWRRHPTGRGGLRQDRAQRIAAPRRNVGWRGRVRGSWWLRLWLMLGGCAAEGGGRVGLAGPTRRAGPIRGAIRRCRLVVWVNHIASSTPCLAPRFDPARPPPSAAQPPRGIVKSDGFPVMTAGRVIEVKDACRF